MKSRLSVWGVVLVISATVLSGAEEPANEVSAGPAVVAAALEPVLKDLKPKVESVYSNQGKTLTLRYLPQTFKVHGVSMTGQVSAEAHDEVGPSYMGFVVTVHLQAKGEVNQLVTPQTVRRPYWSTDLDVIPLAGTDQQAYVGLSYGSRTDPKLLKELRAKLAAMKGTTGEGDLRQKSK